MTGTVIVVVLLATFFYLALRRRPPSPGLLFDGMQIFTSPYVPPGTMYVFHPAAMRWMDDGSWGPQPSVFRHDWPNDWAANWSMNPSLVIDPEAIVRLTLSD